MEGPAREVTQLLMKWRSGDPEAAESLMRMVYPELKVIARRLMASERPDHTLQPTALVHEAFLQLSAMDVPWQDSAHFLATLQKLVAFDSRKSAIIELHYFGGLKQDQIALVLSI